jgi:hypothetical protein
MAMQIAFNFCPTSAEASGFGELKALERSFKMFILKGRQR